MIASRYTYTWAGRIKLLQQLNFIDVKAGRSGPISHVLIWNPHRVIRWHHDQKTAGLVEANFNALLERALDIGANDMLDSGPATPPAPAAAPAPPSATVVLDAATA